MRDSDASKNIDAAAIVVDGAHPEIGIVRLKLLHGRIDHLRIVRRPLASEPVSRGVLKLNADVGHAAIRGSRKSVESLPLNLPASDSDGSFFQLSDCKVWDLFVAVEKVVKLAERPARFWPRQNRLILCT